MILACALIGDYGFVVADAAVEFCKHGGGFLGDDGGFNVRAGESANRVERAPECFNQDFDFATGVPHKELGSPKAIHLAQFGEDLGREICSIFGPLLLRGAGSLLPQDCSQRCVRRG
jgi:hypothetical protein